MKRAEVKAIANELTAAQLDEILRRQLKSAILGCPNGVIGCRNHRHNKND